MSCSPATSANCTMRHPTVSLCRFRFVPAMLALTRSLGSFWSGLSDQDTNQLTFVEAGEKLTLVTVPYDWRRSISEGASTLPIGIERVAKRHGDAAHDLLSCA